MIHDGSASESPCLAVFGKEKRDFSKLFIGDKIENPSPLDYDLNVDPIRASQKSLAILARRHTDSREFI